MCDDFVSQAADSFEREPRWRSGSLRGLWICTAMALACAAFGQDPAARSNAGHSGLTGQASGQARDQANARTNASAPVSENLSELLEGKIRAAWAAFQSKDKKAYGEFLADDFIAVEADKEGERNKWHVLREVDNSVVDKLILSLFKVTPLGPDAAFVTYEAFIQFPPRAAIRFEKIYISEVWVKRKGEWKTLHYQETNVR